MAMTAFPTLSLAISRLHHGGCDGRQFAIWITAAPYPGGYVHHDLLWTPALSQKWIAWQELFSLQNTVQVPVCHPEAVNLAMVDPEPDSFTPQISYGGRLMQDLGVSLWQWVFGGAIANVWAQSRGIAMGREQPLRLHLEIRDPRLITLPWEIMQPQAGKQAISLNRHVLFSRTIRDVESLGDRPPQGKQLRVLLVLGEAENGVNILELEKEAQNLKTLLGKVFQDTSQAMVHPIKTLIQPTPSVLIKTLDQGNFNVFCYSGHGQAGPDGGLVCVHPEHPLNGTELAQVLVRNQVTLGIFNSCWGAQLYCPQSPGAEPLVCSSLAEVLIHQGLPAVLAMRDAIADQEALTFIECLTQELCRGSAIDQAVAIARQQLLSTYKFNQVPWTLPVLYLHPEFDGKLLSFPKGVTTALPDTGERRITNIPPAHFVNLHTQGITPIYSGVMRIGRRAGNELLIREPWVSQSHGEVIYRDRTENTPEGYYFKDYSRFGTFKEEEQGFLALHHEETRLQSGDRLKFGSTYGQTFQFVQEELEGEDNFVP